MGTTKALERVLLKLQGRMRFSERRGLWVLSGWGDGYDDKPLGRERPCQILSQKKQWGPLGRGWMTLRGPIRKGWHGRGPPQKEERRQGCLPPQGWYWGPHQGRDWHHDSLRKLERPWRRSRKKRDVRVHTPGGREDAVAPSGRGQWCRGPPEEVGTAQGSVPGRQAGSDARFPQGSSHLPRSKLLSSAQSSGAKS